MGTDVVKLILYYAWIKPEFSIIYKDKGIIDCVKYYISC